MRFREISTGEGWLALTQYAVYTVQCPFSKIVSLLDIWGKYENVVFLNNSLCFKHHKYMCDIMLGNTCNN